MRSRSTSKQGSRSMEVERPKLKEQPHLSGAYIRSLVKKLSSSMPKGPMNPRSLNGVSGGDGEPSDPTMIGKGFCETQLQQQEKDAQPRKQVRRRVHTSKPYQERIINMAEARREIVTALKFHRAAMKRAREQQQQLQQRPLHQDKPPLAPSPPLALQEALHIEKIEEEDSRLHYPSNYTLSINNPSLTSPSYPPFSWPFSSIAPLPIPEDLNFPLPTWPLGLNLNFQDFNDVDVTLYNDKGDPPILSSTSSPSSSSCSPSFGSSMTSVLPAAGTPPASNVPLLASEAMSDPAAGTLHPAMGDEEMAAIRSIGERHDLEWSDRLNLATSAWWCELLKTIEVSPEGEKAKSGGVEREGNGLGLFEDEVLDVPAWLRDQQQLDDCCYNYSEDQCYLKDASLPCLDVGEFEGMDCEWLS